MFATPFKSIALDWLPWLRGSKKEERLTREAFEEIFFANDFGNAIEHRFPGTALTSIDASWALYEAGGSFDDAIAAAKKVVATKFEPIFVQASLRSLDDYAYLYFKQLLAARAISAHACIAYIKNKLDNDALPPDLVEAAHAWVLRVLKEKPVNRAPLNEQMVDDVRAEVYAAVSEEIAEVMRDFEAYSSEPVRRADAFISFFGAILDLPVSKRYLMVEKIFGRGH